MAEDPKHGTSKSQGWWQSLPGVLTAVAGILTAVAGLLVALHQVGLLERDQAPMSPPSPISNEKSPGSPAPAPTPLGAAGPSEAAAPANGPDGAVVDRMPRYQVTFPSGSAVTLRNNRGEANYRVLGAQAERRSPAMLTLKLAVRLSNAGPLDTGFGSDSFRLLIDGVPRAPASWLNEAVEARSAKEADIVFEVPATARGLELQITSGPETGSLPLRLGPAAERER